MTLHINNFILMYVYSNHYNKVQIINQLVKHYMHLYICIIMGGFKATT